MSEPDLTAIQEEALAASPARPTSRSSSPCGWPTPAAAARSRPCSRASAACRPSGAARSARPRTWPGARSRRRSRSAPPRSRRRRWARPSSATPTDVTLPGDPHPLGALHPITQVRQEMEDILLGPRLPDRRRPRGRDRVARLHGAQHAARPPGALAERHLLHPGPPRPDAAHPDLAGAGARDAALRAADLPHRARAWSTAATTSTPPTARCSTRWRGWRSMRG